LTAWRRRSERDERVDAAEGTERPQAPARPTCVPLTDREGASGTFAEVLGLQCSGSAMTSVDIDASSDRARRQLPLG
jgi:hypothetical protein